ncbi:unnamed protein product [Hymenolepis diminuta]|uniref:RING-type E3 ubiquitin transferase n=1 Tax=Hymenolepis diminuta TaxID=6216 RepID=A0A0R3SRB5_HYMDI|nr:unnamed protein product [Hymenolepis diminuta]VUZ43909.1 unnamed protein product [Hymenolepis diminuta]
MSSRKCRYYLAGYCRNGNSCPFIHVNPYDSQPDQRIPTLSPMVLRTCRFYLKGYCAYGDGCEFFHPPRGINICVGNQSVTESGVQKSETEKVMDSETANSTPYLQGFSFKQTLESLFQEKTKDPETLGDFGYQPEEVYSREENLSAEELKIYSNEEEDAFSYIPLLPPPQNLCI